MTATDTIDAPKLFSHKTDHKAVRTPVDPNPIFRFPVDAVEFQDSTVRSSSKGSLTAEDIEGLNAICDGQSVGGSEEIVATNGRSPSGDDDEVDPNAGGGFTDFLGEDYVTS